jgi:hypothetical protein
MAKANLFQTVITSKRNGAIHHIIIPQYPSGNQTSQFAASYCHPEPEHSRPILKKKRQNEAKLKRREKTAIFKFTI